MHDHLVPVIPATPELTAQARALAERWALPFVAHDALPQQGLVLIYDHNGLSLQQADQPKLGGVRVDFASDALSWRRLHGGGRKEAIARAVGIKGNSLPRVVDATAGLGRDSFVLAALGCQVTMLERSPVAAALLADGLLRAGSDESLKEWLPARMALQHGSSIELMANWQGEVPEVIYLDPMFPHKKKSAAVKKEMRIFQQLLGPDMDSDDLLSPALALASKRVVVKRPRAAGVLAGKQPNMAIESKKHRFDVYITNL